MLDKLNNIHPSLDLKRRWHSKVLIEVDLVKLVASVDYIPAISDLHVFKGNPFG